MATMLGGAVEVMKKVGIFDVFLPFILLFAVIYGILERIKLFGTDKKASNINSVIAFAISFIAISSGWLVPSLQKFLPYVGLGSVIILVFMLFLPIFLGGYESAIKSTWFKVSGVALGGAVMAYSLLSIADINLREIQVNMNEMFSYGVTFGLIAGIVVLMYLITKPSSSSK